nr:hypothetical protein [Tanacetum cinerariifolium]
TTSSPDHSTSNIEDAFSFNFLDYNTASPGNISPDPLDNLPKYLFASLAISPSCNVQAYNAVTNKPPIPPQDPITPPTILTPSSVLQPSPLLDPLNFFVLEELLPLKKQIHPPSSSSTMLSNLSREQAYYNTASPGNISPGPLDNLSKYLFASLAISPSCNVQAYNAVTNKPPILPQDLITPPTILTPSPVLPPSPLFDPLNFFVLEELLPLKKQIHPPSSSSTMLSNSSREQACSTGSSSSIQNWHSSDNPSSTNEVYTAYGVSTSSGHNLQKEDSSSCTDDLMYSFFANQSSGPQLSKGIQDSRRRDAGNTRHKARDNGKRSAKPDEHKAMVTIDGEGVDWTGHAEDDTKDYALIAFNSSNSGSNTK